MAMECFFVLTFAFNASTTTLCGRERKGWNSIHTKNTWSGAVKSSSSDIDSSTFVYLHKKLAPPINSNEIIVLLAVIYRPNARGDD
jgi:hypothetical protein